MRHRSAFTLVEAIAVLVAIGLLVMLCLPAVQSSHPPSRRNMCRNNMRQLGIGTLQYQSVHGSLPPAYTVDASGGRLHSWRSQLLPYIEEPFVHGMIDFTNPWEAAANAKANGIELEAFWCPSTQLTGTETSYLAVVGSGFAYSGTDATKLKENIDGRANTLLLLDAPTRHAQPWMAPWDIDEPKFLSYSPELAVNHPGVILVGFADSHVKPISLDCDPAVRRAMLTITGGEEIDEDAF